MSNLAHDLWRRYRESREPETRLQLIDLYLGLVHHSARALGKRSSRQLELGDLVSAGTVGLIQAMEGFDPSRGLAFSSYAMPRIRGAILDEIRNQDWMPRSVRDRARRIRQVRGELQQRLGHAPEHEDVAKALDIEMSQYWRWQRETNERVIVQLDAPDAGTESGSARAESIPHAVEGPDEELARRETLDLLRAAFETLPERDRLVLALSFYEGLTLRQIGEILHVTESRVSQVRSRALKRLRECLLQEGEQR